jgi:4-oxalocrotonate tautomerase
MPVVIVEMWEGRTVEQKRELVKELTNAFVKVAKTSPDAVTVIMHDNPKSNWGSKGKLASDA